MMVMTGMLTVSAYAAQLVPVGEAIGIEVAVDGVLVSELSSVQTDKGTVKPAEQGKIAPGDVITAINGQDIDGLKDFAEYAKNFDDTPVTLTVSRGGKTLTCKVTPALSVEGKYQLGLWLRDTVAGVGTVTYYDPKTREYGALGHGINDAQSGTLIPITGGEIFDAAIVDVVQGKSGAPGELTGSFDRSALCGDVHENSVYGIFGQCTKAPHVNMKPMETAKPGEAKVGEAKILSTVNGVDPKEYTIRIDRIEHRSGEERYQITVTDPALLTRTGGVVCGMSGSPIVQNGKLIGAVTHVLVNEPTRGYGLSIENMMNAAA